MLAAACEHTCEQTNVVVVVVVIVWGSSCGVVTVVGVVWVVGGVEDLSEVQRLWDGGLSEVQRLWDGGLSEVQRLRVVRVSMGPRVCGSD